MKEQLRRARAERGLSMDSLSRRADLGRTTVSQALNGPTLPSEATVVRVARALGITADPLLALRGHALATAPAVAPAPAPERPESESAPDAAFEQRYRHYVAERHARLSVVGLDLSQPEYACWPLDTAYLSLEFSAPSADPLTVALEGPVHAAPVAAVNRAEQALADLRRTLVRGLAGSGKTTLLQWLAVSAARGVLPAPMAELNRCVPFVLPLRSLVRRGQLPGPEELLTSVGCQLASAQPAGWADRVLHGGRALLLVDGLDEVPQAQRARTRDWLSELLAAYPRVRVLATTRPSAVPEGWLADHGFDDLTVHPMSTRDVGVFVGRWHAAAAEAGARTGHERSQLAGLGEALTDTVRSQRPLAQLTTTPLLCALVCALHRDRRGHLPQGRMELYAAALSMLLVRRDRERGIEHPEGVVLSEQQSIQLLQRLAYWLVVNRQTEMDRDTALAQIANLLSAMPEVAAQGDAATVLDHLVGRSGLLRTPDPDTVDFVHRTFQDYLGAKAAIEAMDLPLLVRNAHDDQWEDVIRMAVGHARPQERAKLLRRLVARGVRSQRHRVRLHLLAMACLENATELDPEVRQEVTEHAAALLPPRNGEEAAVLAAAGPVILDLLPGPDGLDEDEAAAVVHTAGLIGGEAAMGVMKRFRLTTEDRVAWELQSAWARFDAADYAEKVLRYGPNRRLTTVTTAEQFALLRSMETTPEVIVSGSFTGSEIANALAPERLEYLNIQNNPTLREVGFLSAFTEMATLSLLGCTSVRDLAGLADSAVTNLTLDIPTQALDSLAALTRLRRLDLFMPLGLRNIEALPTTADLTSLVLSSTAAAGLSLTGITRWPRLDTLQVNGKVRDLSAIEALTELRLLILFDAAPASLYDEGLPALPQVTSLNLDCLSYWGPENPLVTVPSVFPRLKQIALFCQAKGDRRVDLSPLADLVDLTKIRLYSAREVAGAELFPEGTVFGLPRPRS
ncbi:NACHT domain-containing protein [Kitasatospora sp. NPDC048298]|uniref:NACHT domain-containing protein n=1 Tax=Kitasatospora sp. NPDC048298 TaxID=3364049 RepID=UPI00371F2F83